MGLLLRRVVGRERRGSPPLNSKFLDLPVAYLYFFYKNISEYVPVAYLGNNVNPTKSALHV